MPTPMAEFLHCGSNFVATAQKAQKRIEKIDHMLSLIACVRQHGARIKMNPLTDCMKTVGMEEELRTVPETATAAEVFQTHRRAILMRFDSLHAVLRRERREVRRNMQVAFRNARALRNLAKDYFYRPGTVEA